MADETPEVPFATPQAPAADGDELAGITTTDRHGNPLSEKQRRSILKMKEGRARAVAEGRLSRHTGGRKKGSATKARTSSAPRPGISKARAAAEAAEGTGDLVTQLGVLVAPFTPLGSAYLMASSAEAERVAAHLAEVDPRVMAALMKARRITAWSGVVSLGVGFVGAVMLERDMVPSVIGNVPMGPANVQLGELYATLQAEGHYSKWSQNGAGGIPFEGEGDYGAAPMDVGSGP